MVLRYVSTKAFSYEFNTDFRLKLYCFLVKFIRENLPTFMKNLFKGQTDETPEVLLDLSQQKFRIIGKSECDNPKEFYGEILDALETLTLKSNDRLDCVFNYESMAQQDLKMNLFLFHKLKSLVADGLKLEVKWLVQPGEEYIRKIANDLEYMTDLKIKVIEMDEAHFSHHIN